MLTNESEKLSAVDRVVDNLINALIVGEWKPGDRLPTEPELSQKYGVGRNSVREAIKQLQAFGILYIRRADGTFVTESYSEKMLDPMLYSLILKKHDWQDFVQLRAVVDIGVMHVALENPDVVAVVPRLRELIAESEAELHKPEPSIDRVLELDLAFHRAIAGTIHNAQVDSVTSYITRLTVPSRHDSVRKWLDAHREEEFLDLHRQIADVIERREESQIERVVMQHYIYWK